MRGTVMSLGGRSVGSEWWRCGRFGLRHDHYDLLPSHLTGKVAKAHSE